MHRTSIVLSGITMMALWLPGTTVALPARAADTAGAPQSEQGVQAPVAIAPVPGALLRQFAAPRTRYGRGHRGVDLSAAPDEVVVAAMDGVVSFTGSVAGERWLTLRHAGGLETTYGGVVATVAAGQRVAIGHPIGRLRHGRRHLDWGVRVGEVYLDPAGLLAGWRAVLVAVTDT